MRSFVGTMKKYAVIRAVFYLLLGLAMLIFPETVINIIVYVLAAYVVIMGVMSLVSSRDKSSGKGSLVGGILLIALGACMFVFSHAIVSILPIFIGVLMIIAGITQVIQTFAVQRLSGKLNAFHLILGLLVLIGGVIGIFNPFGTMVFLFRVFGAVSLILAVNEFALYLSLRKAA